ncbi:MAG: hypothetical protein MI746_17945, partial [Pseudomonadales bacterium]|nr:hypothetical protein [Pseudomonadales bacterium]
LISDKGTLVRTRVEEVSVQGRNTQGVRLIRLKEGEKLVGLERVEEPDEVDADSDSQAPQANGDGSQVTEQAPQADSTEAGDESEGDPEE